MMEVVIRGIVERGRQLGQELGFPTVNLALPPIMCVADGVYRSEVRVGERRYDAMSNVGSNPSVGGTERRLETHLFDFSGNLYGCQIEVRLLEKIRDEERFDTLEELRQQLEKDKQLIISKIK